MSDPGKYRCTGFEYIAYLGALDLTSLIKKDQRCQLRDQPSGYREKMNELVEQEGGTRARA